MHSERPPADTGRPADARTWALLASLYSTQFLGLMFFVVALVAILREQGASLATIGQTYLLGMIWPLKMLWAPLVDRFRFGRLGHYRGWLLVTQGLLVATLAGMGWLDVATQFPLIYGLCIVVSILACTQDIAVDGLAVRVLQPVERGMANGIQTAGGIIGNLLGGGVMLMVYPLIGWRGCMLALAAMTAISLLQLVFYPEPGVAAAPARTNGLAHRCITFWRTPGSGRWFLFMLVYTTAGGICYAVMTPALVDFGWSMQKIGAAANMAGSVAGLLSALASGWLIGKLGRSKMTVLGAVMQLAAAGSMAVMVLSHGSGWISVLALILYFALYNPAAAVLATLMMDRASPATPATDYTLQTSVNQLCVMGMTSVGAFLSGYLGYLGVLGIAAFVAVAAIVLAWRPVRESTYV